MSKNKKSEAFWYTGHFLKCGGDIDNSDNAYQEAINVNPEFAQAHFSLGVNLFFEKGDIEAAIIEYRKAIALKSDLNIARYNLAIALEARGQYEEAISELKTLTYLNPNFATAYFKIGQIYRKLNKNQAAIQQFTKSISILEDFPEAHLALAEALLTTKKTESSIRILRHLISHLPNIVKAHMLLGDVLIVVGDRSEAIKEWEKVLKIVQEDSIDGFLSEEDNLCAQQARRNLGIYTVL